MSNEFCLSFHRLPSYPKPHPHLDPGTPAFHQFLQKTVPWQGAVSLLVLGQFPYPATDLSWAGAHWWEARVVGWGRGRAV